MTQAPHLSNKVSFGLRLESGFTLFFEALSVRPWPPAMCFADHILVRAEVEAFHVGGNTRALIGERQKSRKTPTNDHDTNSCLLDTSCDSHRFGGFNAPPKEKRRRVCAEVFGLGFWLCYSALCHECVFSPIRGCFSVTGSSVVVYTSHSSVCVQTKLQPSCIIFCCFCRKCKGHPMAVLWSNRSITEFYAEG